MTLADFVALVVVLYIGLRFYDRLRLINWKTTRPLYVALYLAQVMWVLGIVYDIFGGGMQWHQWFGMVSMWCYLEITRDLAERFNQRFKKLNLLNPLPFLRSSLPHLWSQLYRRLNQSP